MSVQNQISNLGLLRTPLCRLLFTMMAIGLVLPVQLAKASDEPRPRDSHLVVVHGGEGQNGEDGFKIDHQTIIVREDIECALSISPPKSEEDVSFDLENLRGDQALENDIRAIWQRIGQMIKDLRTLGLGQTSDFMSHFLYGGRIKWCFTEFDLKEVNDVGEYDSVVDTGQREGLTVALNQRDFVYLSLPAWKMMKRESSKVKTFLHEVFWSILRESRVEDVNVIVKMVNLVDNKLLASEDVQRLVYQITQLLPTEDSFFLSLLRSDLEIMRSEEGAVQAKLFPHLSLRSRRPQWTFIQTLSLSLPGFGEKLEVTGSNPKDRYQKIFLGENKTLHYEDSTGQIFHRDRQTLNDLCHKSVSDIGQWRLLNEIQFDLLMRNGWAEFLLNPLVEGEMVLVASGDDKKPSLKVIDPRTREDLSHSMPRGHRQYLKYFCVKDEF